MEVNTSDKLIYFGPSLARGQLIRHTIFKGGMPNHVPDVFKKYPLIKFLFATPEDLVEKEKSMETAGTLENQAYDQIKEGGFR